jgi:hypothetical protein
LLVAHPVGGIPPRKLFQTKRKVNWETLGNIDRKSGASSRGQWVGGTTAKQEEIEEQRNEIEKPNLSV